MELQYFGANCLRLSAKKAQIVVDDNLSQVGLKAITKPTDIYLRTSLQMPEHESRFSTEMPGEYEISGVIIHGIAARAFTDGEDQKSAVIYTLSTDNVRVAILGHIAPNLSEAHLEQIGLVDIAVVPVGGNGYTLDGAGALKIIKQIEPKIVIPTHYGDKTIKYGVAQAELSEALKHLGMDPLETAPKYKLNPAELTDTTHLIVLERQ